MTVHPQLWQGLQSLATRVWRNTQASRCPYQMVQTPVVALARLALAEYCRMDKCGIAGSKAYAYLRHRRQFLKG